MNGLPFIDVHSVRLKAPPAEVWTAMLSMLRGMGHAHHGSLTRLLDLQPAAMSGEWRESVCEG